MRLPTTSGAKSQIGSEASSVLIVVNDASSVEQTETGFYYPLGRHNFDSACGRWLARDKLSNPKGCYFGGLYHLGVDMMAKKVGDPVYPIADGEVIGMSTDGEKNAAVFIKHKLSDGSEFVAVYGHIRTSVSAQKHSKVAGGVQFATVGPYSGGNHVHLGIHPEVKSDFTVSEKDKRGKVVKMGWGRASNYFWPNANGFVEPISWITTKTPLSNSEMPPKHSAPQPGGVSDPRETPAKPYFEAKRRDALEYGLYSENLPNNLFLSICQAMRYGKYNRTIFAPNGGWVILPAEWLFGYTSSGLPAEAAAGLSGISTPTQVAIAPNGAWLCVYGVNEKGFRSNNLPQDMLDKMWELYNEDRGQFRNQNPLAQVTFAPNGGWLILYNHVTPATGFGMDRHERRAAYNNLPPVLRENLTELLNHGESVWRVAFTPSGGWVILYGKNGYWDHEIPIGAKNLLSELNKKGMDIRDAFFGPKGGWGIVASH
jgi:hypothetical protein